MTRTPTGRAGGITGHPPAPSAPKPAPEAALTAPGAGRGKVEPSAPARAVPAAVRGGGRDAPSRNATREGTAGPGALPPGPAQSSAPGISLPAPGAGRGKKTEPIHPPAPSRAAPAAVPPGGRGTKASAGAEQGRAPASTSPPDEGKSGGAEGGEPALRRRTPRAGSPTRIDPAGDGRLNAASPAARPLSGDDFRKAWKAAESAKNATARRGRARRPSASASPGVGRLRVAPPRRESFADAPPPEIRIRPPEPPPEAA